MLVGSVVPLQKEEGRQLGTMVFRAEKEMDGKPLQTPLKSEVFGLAAAMSKSKDLPAKTCT